MLLSLVDEDIVSRRETKSCALKKKKKKKERDVFGHY